MEAPQARIAEIHAKLPLDVQQYIGFHNQQQYASLIAQGFAAEVAQGYKWLHFSQLVLGWQKQQEQQQELSKQQSAAVANVASPLRAQANQLNALPQQAFWGQGPQAAVIQTQAQQPAVVQPWIQAQAIPQHTRSDVMQGHSQQPDFISSRVMEIPIRSNYNQANGQQCCGIADPRKYGQIHVQQPKQQHSGVAPMCAEQYQAWPHQPYHPQMQQAQQQHNPSTEHFQQSFQHRLPDWPTQQCPQNQHMQHDQQHCQQLQQMRPPPLVQFEQALVSTHGSPQQQETHSQHERYQQHTQDLQQKQEQVQSHSDLHDQLYRSLEALGPGSMQILRAHQEKFPQESNKQLEHQQSKQEEADIHRRHNEQSASVWPCQHVQEQPPALLQHTNIQSWQHEQVQKQHSPQIQLTCDPQQQREDATSMMVLAGRASQLSTSSSSAQSSPNRSKRPRPPAEPPPPHKLLQVQTERTQQQLTDQEHQDQPQQQDQTAQLCQEIQKVLDGRQGQKLCPNDPLIEKKKEEQRQRLQIYKQERQEPAVQQQQQQVQQSYHSEVKAESDKNKGQDQQLAELLKSIESKKQLLLERDAKELQNQCASGSQPNIKSDSQQGQDPAGGNDLEDKLFDGEETQQHAERLTDLDRIVAPLHAHEANEACFPASHASAQGCAQNLVEAASADNCFAKNDDEIEDARGCWQSEEWRDEKRIHRDDKTKTAYTYEEFLEFVKGDENKAWQMWQDSTPVKENQQPAELTDLDRLMAPLRAHNANEACSPCLPTSPSCTLKLEDAQESEMAQIQDKEVARVNKTVDGNLEVAQIQNKEVPPRLAKATSQDKDSVVVNGKVKGTSQVDASWQLGRCQTSSSEAHGQASSPKNSCAGVSALAEELGLDERAQEAVMELPPAVGFQLLHECEVRIRCVNDPSAFVLEKVAAKQKELERKGKATLDTRKGGKESGMAHIQDKEVAPVNKAAGDNLEMTKIQDQDPPQLRPVIVPRRVTPAPMLRPVFRPTRQVVDDMEQHLLEPGFQKADDSSQQVESRPPKPTLQVRCLPGWSSTHRPHILASSSKARPPNPEPPESDSKALPIQERKRPKVKVQPPRADEETQPETGSPCMEESKEAEMPSEPAAKKIKRMNLVSVPKQASACGAFCPRPSTSGTEMDQDACASAPVAKMPPLRPKMHAFGPRCPRPPPSPAFQSSVQPPTPSSAPASALPLPPEPAQRRKPSKAPQEALMQHQHQGDGRGDGRGVETKMVSIVEDFIESEGLDAEAAHALRSCGTAVQAVVMESGHDDWPIDANPSKMVISLIKDVRSGADEKCIADVPSDGASTRGRLCRGQQRQGRLQRSRPKPPWRNPGRTKNIEPDVPKHSSASSTGKIWSSPGDLEQGDAPWPTPPSTQPLTVQILTYGVRYAERQQRQPQANLYFDARCFNDPDAGELKHHDGNHEEIIYRLSQHENFDGWFLDIMHQLREAVDKARYRGESIVRVAVYCKSGRHRSVASGLMLEHVLLCLGDFHVILKHLHLHKNKCSCSLCNCRGEKAERAMDEVLRMCEAEDLWGPSI